MPFRNFVLLACSVLLAAPSGRAASASKEAEYLGGSVKSIRVNTVGSLDLDDLEDLQFKSNGATMRVPYARIKTVNFDHAQSQTRKVAHVPLPKLPLFRRDQRMDLSFRDENGRIGTMSFRLTGKALSSAEFILSERMDSSPKSRQNAARTKLPEAWWGDKYWKTTRNKGAWPDPEPAGTAGTK